MSIKSVLTEKGLRHKGICSLGNLAPHPVEEWLGLAKRVENALAGQSELFKANEGELEQIVERIRNRKRRQKPGDR